MTTTTQSVQKAKEFKGNDSALLGIVLAVITFWLFAQTTLNIGPAMGQDIGTPAPVMNIANFPVCTVFRHVHRRCWRFC